MQFFARAKSLFDSYLYVGVQTSHWTATKEAKGLVQNETVNITFGMSLSAQQHCWGPSSLNVSCRFGGQPEWREGWSTASQNISLTNGFTIWPWYFLAKKFPTFCIGKTFGGIAFNDHGSRLPNIGTWIEGAGEREIAFTVCMNNSGEKSSSLIFLSGTFLKETFRDSSGTGGRVQAILYRLPKGRSEGRRIVINETLRFLFSLKEPCKTLGNNEEDRGSHHPPRY